jgi:Flp pilus assembly protein TadG
MRSNKDGVAAAETAMLTPILLVLLFGAFEMGKYFLDEHVLMKAVRDGARYAGRQSFASMPCGGTATNETAIKNFVRFGNIAGTGNPRLPY